MKSINLNFKSIKRLFSRRPKLPGQRNPTRDWLRIIIVTAVGILIICVLGLFLFYGVERGLLFVPEAQTETKAPVFDQSSITSVGSYYDQKEARLNDLRATSSTMVDPAL
jgi:ABC-type phosphate transport system auxiliary subunit